MPKCLTYYAFVTSACCTAEMENFANWDPLHMSIVFHMDGANIAFQPELTTTQVFKALMSR